jgi:hypothetical protein
MADAHKEDAAAKAAGTKTSTTGHNISGTLLDEAASEAADATAFFLYNRLTPEVREKLRRNANYISLLRVVRAFLPWQNTTAGHTFGEFLSDFARDFKRIVQEGPDRSDHTHQEETKTEERKKEDKRLNKILEVALAVQDLDEATRNDFEEWWLSTEDRRSGFLYLIKEANEDQIKKLASRPVPELDRLIGPLKTLANPATPTAHETPDSTFSAFIREVDFSELQQEFDAETDRLEEELERRRERLELNRLPSRGERQRARRERWAQWSENWREWRIGHQLTRRLRWMGIRESIARWQQRRHERKMAKLAIKRERQQLKHQQRMAEITSRAR